jgi:hypothetical protein
MIQRLPDERETRTVEKGTFYFSVEELASPPGDLNTTGMIDASANMEDRKSRMSPFLFCESGENEGTGLGLTIVHQIIREHQGTIHVQSTEGVGTTFRINLPSIV